MERRCAPGVTESPRTRDMCDTGGAFVTQVKQRCVPLHRRAVLTRPAVTVDLPGSPIGSRVGPGVLATRAAAALLGGGCEDTVRRGVGFLSPLDGSAVPGT
ncbi:hypothetical protein GCM10027162_63250 [Streptomyces incanus]